MPHNPIAIKPAPPRYTQRPLPLYRYLPFQGSATLPHPRNDPAGHSFDADEDYLPHFMPEDWTDCEPYLYGIDLFNHGYWWEAHEAFEVVWLAAGQRETLCGIFVQGLIQLAVAQLKRVSGSPSGAQSLTAAGCEKLAVTEEIYLGIEVAALIAEAQRCLREDRGEFPRITLHFPGKSLHTGSSP
jgi:predicted metal-dependent hydrolase